MQTTHLTRKTLGAVALAGAAALAGAGTAAAAPALGPTVDAATDAVADQDLGKTTDSLLNQDSQQSDAGSPSGQELLGGVPLGGGLIS
ncbi:hypothetical protein [Streptomyces sulphureus]|uniref:hypothetical protein n=1 Tax=Streptomyces sulphureus TaxID=47758 RepID=UPI000361DC38|nr:hypothetical protein [Streptomyces sulphureus]